MMKFNPTHQITLQSKSMTQDDELNSVETWNTWRTIWAEPLGKTSREFYRLANQNSEITAVFRMQYIYGVNAHQRVKFKNRYLEMTGDPINEGERNVSLLLTCKGVV